MERIIARRFRLLKRLGAGSFGEIFSAEDLEKGTTVAIKLEHTNARVPQLLYEAKLYNTFAGGVSTPRFYAAGTDGAKNYMAIELLGKSLENLFVLCGNRLSVKTVLMLADQMISAVQYIHLHHYIHRDVKPDNFVIGVGSHKNQIYAIDYGLSKRFEDSVTLKHIPYIEGKSLTGTARYASVNALRGCEQSRRDDMESLGYVWLYFLRGTLPWMGLRVRDEKQKNARIMDVKARTPIERLCSGFPYEFIEYFRQVKTLKFQEEPDYSSLRQLFRRAMNRLGYVYDYNYDWVEHERRQIPRTAVEKRPTAVPAWQYPVPRTALDKKVPTGRPSRTNMATKDSSQAVAKALTKRAKPIDPIKPYAPHIPKAHKDPVTRALYPPYMAHTTRLHSTRVVNA